MGKIFFHEIDPVVRLGARKSLEPADLPELPESLRPASVPIEESRIDWSSAPRLIVTLSRVSRRIWLGALGFELVTALLNLSTPLLVNAFVSSLENGAEGDLIWVMGALIGLVGMLSGLCIQHFFYRALGLNQILTNTLNKKLFTHALRLSKESREQVPIGDIVNHMSSDTDALAEAPTIAADLIYNAVVLIGAGAMMLYYLGWTAVLAWVLLLSLIPLTRKVSRDFSHMDELLMQERDQRVTLMSQILSAIRVVKFFVWEASVTNEVARVRERELKARERLSIAELTATLSYVGISTLVLFAVLFAHSLRGFELSAALVFTCVSLFNLLEDPFSSLSRQISSIINARVAARRISAFLARETRDPREPLQPALPGQPAVELRDWALGYAGAARPVLQNVDLRIARGEKVAIVGAVGAGKSSLLLGLLGELKTQTGTRAVRAARWAYVPQEAYLVNGSLRTNLLLGEEAANERLEQALWRSCLDEDMRLWDAGLDTEIGERGVNLSGGQKQRLSLARADLQDADLLLLDDPLSAVDPSTETRLMQRLVLESWQGKTCLMATHRLEHLADFDRVLFLREGRIWAEGSHAALWKEVPEYRDFLAEHEKTQHAEFGKIDRTETAPAAISGSALKITQDEEREQGAVKGSVYGDYLRSLGGTNPRWRPLRWAGLIAAACASTALPLLQKSWLGFATNVQNDARALPGWIADEGWRVWITTPWQSVVVYGALGMLTLAGILAADLFWLRRGLAAGRDLHDSMLRSVLGAPIRFFDSTPVGRILQRFSRDLESIDVQLQWTFEQSMKAFANVFVTLALIFSVLPVVLLAVLPVLFVYWRCQKLYRQAAREAKRLDSIARSPRYAHFKETLQGLTVIRAFDRADWFFAEFLRRLHESQRLFFGHYLINRWFSTRIPVIGGLISVATGIAIVAAVKAGALSPGIAGLLTVYSLSFWGVLNWGIRLWADVEARMTSVERVRFLGSLAQERVVTHAEPARLAEWPSRGHVEFRAVKARYATELPWVLKGVSFEIPGGSRVGLIGRTGSGKSTVFQALYRFIELDEGEILVDGVNLAAVPLARLRKALAVIPQDPTLFLGTLRSNLDRFAQFTELELQTVLQRTSLKTWVDSLPQGLDTPVVENGHNLSQGQRQLLCLARALLLKAKILIMDEATASVDVQTDALIQRLIRDECQGMTIIMIAHRLGTVRDCDQVIELADGQVRRILHPKIKSEPTAPSCH